MRVNSKATTTGQAQQSIHLNGFDMSLLDQEPVLKPQSILGVKSTGSIQHLFSQIHNIPASVPVPRWRAVGSHSNLLPRVDSVGDLHRHYRGGVKTAKTPDDNQPLLPPFLSP